MAHMNSIRSHTHTLNSLANDKGTHTPEIIIDSKRQPTLTRTENSVSTRLAECESSGARSLSLPAHTHKRMILFIRTARSPLSLSSVRGTERVLSVARSFVCHYRMSNSMRISHLFWFHVIKDYPMQNTRSITTQARSKEKHIFRKRNDELYGNYSCVLRMIYNVLTQMDYTIAEIEVYFCSYLWNVFFASGQIPK